MDVADGSSVQAEGQPRTLLDQLQAFGPSRILALGVVALALAGFFAFVIFRSMEQPYTLLYGGLDPADARQVVQRLDALQVPYRIGPAGDAVMVPADRALRLRMDLAEEGLPAGGAVGYEVFDHQSPLGTTDFLSNLNLKRALEGELARTIGSLRSVRQARVHIVMPKRELFERERQKPTASIVLGVAAGGIDNRQLQGIRNLVAAAVPGLDAGRVTIVDDRGNLLVRASDGSQSTLAASNDLEELKTAQEQRIKTKIVQLLERTVGPGRVVAEVTADLDFDELTINTENFDPNGQVARSTQTVEEQGDRREDESAANTTVANNLPTERAQPGGGSKASERNNRNEETTNYEISKTIRSQVRKGGTIRRLSIAVQVDGIYKQDAAGQPQFSPRADEELAQIAALVRSAAGVDEERGDVVEVVSRQFVATPEPEAADPGLAQLLTTDYARFVDLAVLALLTLLVLVLGVRPLIRTLAPAEKETVLIERSAGSARLLADEPGQEALAMTGTVGGAGFDTAMLGDADAARDALAAARGAAAAGLDAPGLLAEDPEAVKTRDALIKVISEAVERNPDRVATALQSWLNPA